MERILIVTATMDKMVSAGIANLFGAVHKENHTAKHYKFSTLVMENIHGHAMMRNIAARHLLNSDCDRLWFIDNDVIPADNMLDMLDAEGDIVAAVVPFIYCTSGAYLKIRDLDDLSTKVDEHITTGKILDVTCVGTGCTLIRREVFEDKRMHLSRDYIRPDGRPDRLNDDEPPAIFRYNFLPHGGTLLGEDFDFCYRASKLGYRVRYDGRVICDHIKTTGLLELIERAKRQWQEAQASLSVA